MIRVKICGVTTPDDARMVCDAGADAIGLNFYPKSSRYLEPTKALQVIRALTPIVAPIGVFVGTPLRHATAIAYQLGLRSLQTYDETPPTESTLPFGHIASFRVKNEASLLAIEQYLKVAEERNLVPGAILIDAFVDGEMGGTGHTAPWQLLRDFKPTCPWILAGGLTPTNIAYALETLTPWGVDVASGVESSPGMKDPVKVQAFIKEVHRA